MSEFAPSPVGEWVAEGACRDAPVDIFFPGPNKPKTEAVAYCDRCSVRVQCLDDALDHWSSGGIRAGTTEKERRRLRRARRGA